MASDKINKILLKKKLHVEKAKKTWEEYPTPQTLKKYRDAQRDLSAIKDFRKDVKSA